MSKNSLKTITTVGAVIGAIAGANAYIDHKAMSKKLNENRSGEYYSWKYGNIFYSVYGEGAPILLIHNLHHDESSFEWKKLIPRLKEKYKVYTIDLLGCGKSDKPNITYANYLYVQLISAFIKDVIKEKTDIIVTGDSVPFVIMSKRIEPELIGKVIAINPADIRNQLLMPDRRSKLFAGLLCTPVIGRFLYNLINRPQHTDILLSKFYYYNPYIITQELKDYYYETSHLSKSRGRFLLASIIGHYTNLDIRKAVRETNDFYIVASKNRHQASSIFKGYLTLNPEIEVCSLSSLKLLPQLENPEKTFEGIMRFL